MDTSKRFRIFIVLKHPKKTTMKLFEKIKNDPRVAEIWSEGSWTLKNEEDDGGWWVSLKEGFEWYGCGTIHERTLTNVLKALRQVEKTPKP